MHDPPLVRPAVALIIVRGNDVLLGLRQGGTDPDTWGTPGGKIDFGETAAQAAERELDEEAGTHLHVTTPRLLPIIATDIYPERGEQYSTHVFLSAYLSGEPELVEPEKCREWRWWPWNALPEAVWGGVVVARRRYDTPEEMRRAASHGERTSHPRHPDR